MKPAAQDLVRKLRREPTWAERKLWSRLRSQRLGGYKFRRQHPLGRYALDFYCISAKLAVEVDGDPHGTPQGRIHDRERDALMAALGIKTMRFWNEEIRENLEGVLDTVLAELEKRTGPDPSP